MRNVMSFLMIFWLSAGIQWITNFHEGFGSWRYWVVIGPVCIFFLGFIYSIRRY